MSKFFSVYSGEEHFIASVKIPQASPAEPFNIFFAMMLGNYHGWFMSLRVGKGEVHSARFNRTPGEFIYQLREDLSRKLSRLLLRFDPRPYYSDWRAYYHVDHYEEWGCHKHESGRAAVKWMDMQDLDQDTECSFSYQWPVRDDSGWKEYLRLQKKEEDTGYRQLSCDHQLEHYEEYGW